MDVLFVSRISSTLVAGVFNEGAPDSVLLFANLLSFPSRHA